MGAVIKGTVRPTKSIKPKKTRKTGEKPSPMQKTPHRVLKTMMVVTRLLKPPQAAMMSPPIMAPTL